jgi:serine phosphatase RsbU (regulator of sigma subunit)
MFEDTSFTSAEVSAAAGDLFVLLTDGLTEVFDNSGQELGLDRVKALISEHARAPLEQIEDRLLATVRAHGQQLDDQTVFLIRRRA